MSAPQHTAVVTQADREAAAAFMRRDGASKIDEYVAKMYERGERDDQPLAQLLARHRTEATADLVEALEAAVSLWAFRSTDEPQRVWLEMARAAIARAGAA